MENLDKQLGVNKDRLATMIGIKEDYLDGKISVEEGNRLLREKIGTCTPDEFAYGEQSLKGKYNDETVTERMDDLLRLFDGVLVRASVRDYPEGSPLWAYTEEHKAFNALLDKAEALLQAPKLIKNPWYEIFDDLKQWRTHLARKQNQLYPALEAHGFDRPTRIMWTFDDATRDSI
ncbi:MAG: hemerythrin domain-containing protein, partial [Veillonella sp.]|nr:hemerythrin domain-containing protein [Veillonella sp.]